MDPIVFNFDSYTGTVGNHTLEIALSKHIGFPKKNPPHLQCDSIGTVGGDDFILLAVADGVGAREESAEASKVAIEEAERFTCKPGECSGLESLGVEDLLTFDSRRNGEQYQSDLTFEQQCAIFPELQIFARASKRIQKIEDGNTTLLLALYFEHEGELYRRISHVGDCRFYSRQDGKDLQQITKDHGFLQMVRDDILNPNVPNPHYVTSEEEITELGNKDIIEFLEEDGPGFIEIGGEWYRRPFVNTTSYVQRNINMLGKENGNGYNGWSLVDIHTSKVEKGDVDMGCSDGICGFIDQSDYVRTDKGIWIKKPTEMDDSLKRAEERDCKLQRTTERYCGQFMEDAYNSQNAQGSGDNMACFTVCVK